MLQFPTAPAFPQSKITKCSKPVFYALYRQVARWSALFQSKPYRSFEADKPNRPQDTDPNELRLICSLCLAVSIEFIHLNIFMI